MSESNQRDDLPKLPQTGFHANEEDLSDTDTENGEPLLNQGEIEAIDSSVTDESLDSLLQQTREIIDSIKSMANSFWWRAWFDEESSKSYHALDKFCNTLDAELKSIEIGWWQRLKDAIWGVAGAEQVTRRANKINCINNTLRFFDKRPTIGVDLESSLTKVVTEARKNGICPTSEN